MTCLSVNLNKLALLRNSRGSNFPDICEYAKRFIKLGVQGITIHPRPDERHITRMDVAELSELLQDYPDVEFNIEGFPSEDFLKLVVANKPQQCTLVPDKPGQLTSDHGWNCIDDALLLEQSTRQLQDQGIRVSLFLDPNPHMTHAAAETGADRIELYTEDFARAFLTPEQDVVLEKYRKTAAKAQSLGLGVNAGHDLNLQNLRLFLDIPDILEVSIGHALIIECIDLGISDVIQRYLSICKN